MKAPLAMILLLAVPIGSAPAQQPTDPFARDIKIRSHNAKRLGLGIQVEW